jgi:signal transduction histidine kinase
MWLLQYFLGGIFVLFVSAYVFSRRSPSSKTLTLKVFFMFGLLTALWEFATFFQRAASTAEGSAIFFYVLLITSSLSQPVYLLTVLSIQKEKCSLLLVFVPVLLRLFTFFFLTINFVLTPYGWSYLIYPELSFEVGTTVFFGYLFASIIILIELARKARSAILRRKYVILLVSFTLFQAIGFPLTNYLLTINHAFPPLGGILQFLTFIAIGVAVMLKEPPISSSIGGINSFQEVYLSFLTDFYNLTIDTNLGEASFKFTDFLKYSLIDDKVSVSKKEITFKVKDLDLLPLLNRNLKFLEEVEDNKLTDHYLRVLNAAHLELGDKFDAVITQNMNFLKRSDLIYAISGGKYLKQLDEDKSLDGLSDVEACLKIYKRLLLIVSQKLPMQKFQKKILLYQNTKTVKSTKYGEISIEATKDAVSQLPKDQRISSIIESFNPLVSWVYETVLSIPAFDDKLLDNLKLALRLNRERAVQLRIYPTLLERLAAKIPKEDIEQLYHEYLEEVIAQKSGELKQVRSHLLESERLSAIGRTTAMVGHDLRNPLQVIINTLYLARMKLELIPPQIEKEDLEEIYNTIESQVMYMNKIVTDLQDFSRPITVKPIKTDLKELIEKVLSSVPVPDDVHVSVKIGEDFPMFPVDSPSLKRVLSNLILNAIQAMPDGGSLTVAVSSTDEHVIITVEDTGVGIPQESMPKIFEAFFTTKAQGQGLGLSICKKFVEANGGSIEVESEEGKGTIFTVKLPRN